MAQTILIAINATASTSHQLTTPPFFLAEPRRDDVVRVFAPVLRGVGIVLCVLGFFTPGTGHVTVFVKVFTSCFEGGVVLDRPVVRRRPELSSTAPIFFPM